jgi:hypothetical protein
MLGEVGCGYGRMSRTQLLLLSVEMWRIGVARYVIEGQAWASLSAGRDRLDTREIWEDMRDMLIDRHFSNVTEYHKQSHVDVTEIGISILFVNYAAKAESSMSLFYVRTRTQLEQATPAGCCRI